MCWLKMRVCKSLTDLILLSLNEFDVPLGIDWLFEHDASINCKQKRIALRCQNSEVIKVKANKIYCMINIIFTISTREPIKKRCDA